MQNKTCLVTGTSAGIGKTTALGLAKMGAKVVMVCRSRERGQAALAEIKRESGNHSIYLLLADLSSQASIRQLIAHYKTEYPSLHVLINNAATIPQKRIVSEDGLETQFAVNHLAYFLLTNSLLDLLKASAPSRIVNVSSQAHRGVSIDFDDLQSEHSYSARRAYARTKLANVLFTYELTRRLSGTRLTANCMHPGVVATKLFRDYVGVPKALRFVTTIAGSSPEKGARSLLYLATSPDLEEITGQYFVNRKAVRSSSVSYDRTVARRLWQMSAQLTGLPVSCPLRPEV